MATNNPFDLGTSKPAAGSFGATQSANPFAAPKPAAGGSDFANAGYLGPNPSRDAIKQQRAQDRVSGQVGGINQPITNQGPGAGLANRGGAPGGSNFGQGTRDKMNRIGGQFQNGNAVPTAAPQAQPAVTPQAQPPGAQQALPAATGAPLGAQQVQPQVQEAQVQQAQPGIQVQPPPQAPATQAQPAGLMAAPAPMGGQAGQDMNDPQMQKQKQQQQIMSTFGPQIQEVQALGDAMFKQYGSDQTSMMADPRFNQLQSMAQKLNTQIGAQMQQLNQRDTVDVRDPGTMAAPQNIQGGTPVETMANYRAANQGETMRGLNAQGQAAALARQGQLAVQQQAWNQEAAQRGTAGPQRY